MKTKGYRKCKKPFINYIMKKPARNRDNRLTVCLIYVGKKNKRNKLMSYARYLMSVKLDRRLTRDEEVDHIDGDCTNDVYSNLQILSPTENRRKQFKDKAFKEKHRATLVLFWCPICGKKFKRPKWRTFLGNCAYTKTCSYVYCSKECQYKGQGKDLGKQKYKFLKARKIEYKYKRVNWKKVTIKIDR